MVDDVQRHRRILPFKVRPSKLLLVPGLASRVGSLEPGKLADPIIFSMRPPTGDAARCHLDYEVVFFVASVPPSSTPMYGR